MNWIWFFIRVAGLSGYVLLTLSVLAGILRHIPRKKAPILEFHQIIGQIALLAMALHAYLLFYDHYQPYSLLEVLVPFMSQHDRVLTGLGTIAIYMLIIVIITSDFMKAIGRKVWKKTHYLVFPLWFLSWIHSFFIGTDSQTFWGQLLYWSSFLMVLGATTYLVVKMSRRKSSAVVMEVE